MKAVSRVVLRRPFRHQNDVAHRPIQLGLRQHGQCIALPKRYWLTCVTQVVLPTKRFHGPHGLTDGTGCRPPLLLGGHVHPDASVDL